MDLMALTSEQNHRLDTKPSFFNGKKPYSPQAISGLVGGQAIQYNININNNTDPYSVTATSIALNCLPYPLITLYERDNSSFQMSFLES